MKMIKRKLTKALGALLALVWFGAPQVLAQDGKPDLMIVEEPWNKQIEDIQFEGLPLEEVIGFLRREFDGVNFILSEDIEDVPIKLILRRVNLSDILEGISLASGGLVECVTVSERLVNVLGHPSNQMKSQIRAFSLRNYLAGLEGDEREEAIVELHGVLDHGWAMMAAAGQGGGGRRPELSIHNRTKILIVVGQAEQLRVVEEIVGALQVGVPTRSMMGAGYGMGFGGGGGGAYGGGGSDFGGFGSSGGMDSSGNSRYGGQVKKENIK